MDQLQLVLPLEVDGHALRVPNVDSHIADGVVVAVIHFAPHPGRPVPGTCGWGRFSLYTSSRFLGLWQFQQEMCGKI